MIAKQRFFIRDVILLLIASTSVYLLMLWYLGFPQGMEFLSADEQEYFTLAKQLVDGDFTLYPRRVMGHVTLLAAGLAMGGSSLVNLQIFITTLFSLSVPLLYILVTKITEKRSVALSSAILVLFWPPFLYYGASLYSETTALPCFLAFLILLPKGELFGDKSKSSWIRWILAGALLGICMHIRPMYLLYVPFAFLVVLLESKSFKRMAKNSIFLLLGMVVVVLPWSLYISTQTNHFMILSSNGGETVAGGINPRLIEEGVKAFNTSDGRVTWVGPGKWSADPGYLSDREKQLSRPQQSSIAIARVKDWIWKHPRDFIYLESAKLAYMWSGYPFKDSWKILLLGGLSATFFLVGWLGALVCCRASLRQLSRFWLLPIFVSVVALISWGSWRFRQPGLVGALVMTVFLIDLCVTRFRLKLKKSR